ncbi:hypothetical protein GCM10007919_29000 [Rhizobium indigoferae]|nr:hypothetical protein GCM10007919_29000 [Rhizobium indigoferae]
MLPAIAKGTIDLHHAVTEFAAGAGKSTVDFTIDEESSAENLASIDCCKILLATSRSEPSVTDKQGAGVMIDDNREREVFL